MKAKRKRLILSSSLLFASFLAVSINHAFSSPYILNNASSIGIGISGIKLGDASYYVFFGDQDYQRLDDDDNDDVYTASINVGTASAYSYKITDSFGNKLYSSSEFDLGITGDFSLSFDATDKLNYSSSLTYSLSLVDEGNAFDASDTALPYCFLSEETVTRVDWWVVGQYSDSNQWWSQSDGGIRMISEGDNKGYAPHVHLPAGSQFKIYNGDTNKNYYGTKSFLGGDAVDDFTDCNKDSLDSYADSNITVKDTAGGYYDIYFNSECKIYINKSAAISADNFNSDTNTSTFTLDATKYASSSTYLSFSNSASSKATQGFSVGSLTSANCSLTLKKYLYLDVSQSLGDGNGWYSDSAYFKAYVWASGASSTLIDLVNYPDNDTGNLYRLSSPVSTKCSNAKFVRYGLNNGTEAEWNNTGDITNITAYVFKITGWDKAYSIVSDSTYPEFIVEKASS